MYGSSSCIADIKKPPFADFAHIVPGLAHENAKSDAETHFLAFTFSWVICYAGYAADVILGVSGTKPHRILHIRRGCSKNYGIKSSVP